MKTITARDANQNFSKVLAEVEQGETVLITKNGKTVAELRPRADDPREDPVWRAKFEHMMQLMRETPDTGYRIGKITKDDRYGDAPIGSTVYARQKPTSRTSPIINERSGVHRRLSIVA